MFPSETYIARRKRLKQQMQSGIILFLGNDESPMNYLDNPYPFRQDSSFLYYFGLDVPRLAALIDIDQNRECVFGDDLTVDDIIWMGTRPTLAEKCQQAGIYEINPFSQLETTLSKAAQQDRKIHFLPPYRHETTLQIAQLLRIHPSAVQDCVSVDLVKTVVAHRSVKEEGEIAQIQAALEITSEMQILAMKMARAGRYEREIVGKMEGLALAKGSRPAFPTIFTIRGQTLHNHDYSNQMKAGDIAINDSGAESSLHYASDITRTIPVSGKFSQKQKEIYSVVLESQEKAIEMIKPGVEFRDIHRHACLTLTEGLKNLNLVKGDIQEAVQAGAHTLFFPCGLGHMLGLDVHDMEALGEDYVGYTDTIKRNPEFGWRSLRLAKALEPGYVVTVEPGIYFIPELIDRWKAEQKCSAYINYAAVEKYRDFGGIRIEDDVLVTDNGHRVLGKKIPKSIEEVQALSSCEL
jgi:Xaa-Pro aminopeptidase